MFLSNCISLGLSLIEEINEKDFNDYKIQNMSPEGAVLYYLIIGKYLLGLLLLVEEKLVFVLS